jgi:PAS domain S-box-containing protein
MLHPLSKKENKFLLVSLTVFLISAFIFLYHLNQYSVAVRENLAVENKITKIDRINSNYLSSVIHKRGYQFQLDKASLDQYLQFNQASQALIEDFSDEVDNPEIGTLYEELVKKNLERKNLLDRHIFYLNSMPFELAVEKIKAENNQAISTSLGLEDAIGNLRTHLVGESLKLQKISERLSYINSTGFAFLGFLVVLLIIGTYGQTRKNTLLEADKKLRDEIHSITRNSEIEFRATFELAAIGMALVTEVGRFKEVNPSLCSLLGYTKEELLKLTFMDITHPDDLSVDLEYLKQVLEKKIESYSMEKRYFSKDGATVWINLNVTAVWNEAGSFRHFIAQIVNITPRKLAYSTLDEQKSKIENIIRGTHAGTWEWNVQTGATDFNETWAEIIGYTLDELHPISIETWVKHVHPDDLELSNARLQKCFSGESEYYECECRMRHKNGSWVWVLDRGKVISWTPDGKPEKMYGTHLDISNFKNLERDLRSKETFLNTVLDTVDVGIVVCNEKGELTMFNRATREFHGLGSEDISPAQWASHYQLLKEDGKTLLKKEEVPLYRALIGDCDSNQILCVRHVSGEFFYLNTSGSQIIDEDGNIQGAVVAMSNITEAREAALVLEQSERKFRGIFNSTFQFIGFMAPDGTLLEANETALDFAGLLPEDVVGKKFWDCYWWQISPETQEQLRQSVAKAAQGEFVQYEVEIWDKDKNPVTILFNLKPILDRDGKVNAIVPEGRLIQDIVDARKSLIGKNLELEHFASVASHDMKEPLRMVISFMSLLQKKYKGQLDQQADQYIHFAVDAAHRMNVLITDLLEFSRVGTEHTAPEPIDLHELLDGQGKYYAALLGECGGTLSYSWLPTIAGRKVPINVLFRNLIGNAIKYRTQERPPEITIEGREYENHWKFSVADNGIGFDQNQAEKIFEMFNRLHTRQEYAGTGLGLSICRKIVEQHRGKIWAESAVGKGSIFHFTVSKNL